MGKIRFGPDGAHWFDRVTGTNLLLDEIILPKSRWTFSPRQVSIALTNACDLECTHCYASKKPSRLNLSTLKNWLLELDKADCFGVGFGGGEPLLYPGFFELCDFAYKNTDMAITLTTHGHRLCEKSIARLESSVNFIRVSMDGVEETYEKIRGASFSTLLEKLALLKHRVPFGINCVVNAITIKDLPLVAKIAEKYHAKELLLLPELGHGRGSMIASSTLAELAHWIKSYEGSVQLALSNSHADLVEFEKPLSKETEELGFAHISADGVLRRSSFDATGQPITDRGVIDAFNNLVVSGGI